MTQLSTLKLSSKRLQVELSLPGSAYRGARFDWTGFITQVTLDGVHTFCVLESLKPGSGSGGSGLCNEFGIDLPIGFDDANVGELFPKLGIGLLRKPDAKAYDFSRAYEIAQPFPVQVESGPDWARIAAAPVECRGYAALLTKAFRVQDNRLEVHYRLENKGQKPILTHEYAHNFVGIDQQPLGPDYRLRFPYPAQLDSATTTGMELLSIQANEIGFKGPLPGLYLRPQGYARTSLPQWEMSLLSNRVGMRETNDFAPIRVAVWGTFHVLSPEIFIGINLQPGETQEWLRRYEFFD